MFLTVLLCGAVVLRYPRSISAKSETESSGTIHYADISGDYLFISNLDETERMALSLRDYLGDSDLQIQTTVPDEAVCYAESTWDPAKAASIPGSPIYCVEAWDIFKNGEFQKTTYLAGRI